MKGRKIVLSYNYPYLCEEYPYMDKTLNTI